jgi:hypothetical protein
MQEPDYSEWTQRQLWTLVESACLLSGIAPVPPKQFDGAPETGGVPAKIYADLKNAIDLGQIEFVESRDQFFRGRRVKPDECVTWAAGRGYAIPAALLCLKKRDPDETAEQRKDRLRRRVAEERAKGNKAPLKTVAKEEGRSVSRVKQLIGPAKRPAEKTASGWGSALTGPASKTSPIKPRSKY